VSDRREEEEQSERDDDDDLDPEREELLYLKYCFEGVSSLPELAVALRRMALDLEARVAEGWYLAESVDGGWAHLRKDEETG